MELPQHFVLHCVCVGILAFFNYFWLFIPDGSFFFRLIGSFLINPDLDFIFKKWGWHRSAWFHSALLPMAFYLVLRPDINISNRLEFSLILFFPVIVHLFGDSKPHRLLSAFYQDYKEYRQELKEHASKGKDKRKSQRRSVEIRIREGNEEYGGTWQLSIQPFSKDRLSFYKSLIWMMTNGGIMVGLIIYYYFFP